MLTLRKLVYRARINVKPFVFDLVRPRKDKFLAANFRVYCQPLLLKLRTINVAYMLCKLICSVDILWFCSDTKSRSFFPFFDKLNYERFGEPWTIDGHLYIRPMAIYIKLLWISYDYLRKISPGMSFSRLCIFHQQQQQHCPVTFLTFWADNSKRHW